MHFIKSIEGWVVRIFEAIYKITNFRDVHKNA